MLTAAGEDKPQELQQPEWLEGRRSVPLSFAVASLLQEWTYPKALLLEEADDDFCGWSLGTPQDRQGDDAVKRQGRGKAAAAKVPLSREEEEALSREESRRLETLLVRCVRERACSQAQADTFAQQFASGVSSLQEVSQHLHDLLSLNEAVRSRDS
eukprot:5482166-Prymnesium_polylepis.1